MLRHELLGRPRVTSAVEGEGGPGLLRLELRLHLVHRASRAAGPGWRPAPPRAPGARRCGPPRSCSIGRRICAVPVLPPTWTRLSPKPWKAAKAVPFSEATTPCRSALQAGHGLRGDVDHAQHARHVDEEGLAVRVADLRHHPRPPQRPPVHQGGVAVGQLQGGAHHGALADGHVHQVAARPGAFQADQPGLVDLVVLEPLLVGDDAGLLVGQVDPGERRRSPGSGPSPGAGCRSSRARPAPRSRGRCPSSSCPRTPAARCGCSPGRGPSSPSASGVLGNSRSPSA